MGVYIGTTQISRARVNYLYRCSNCGTAVLQNTYIEGTGFHYAGIGEKASIKKAGTRLQNNLKNALDSAKEGHYRQLKINNKCPKCRKRMPWQRYMYPSWMILINLILGIVPIIFFSILFNNPKDTDRQALIVIGLITAAIILLNVYFIARKHKLDEICSQLEEIQRPQFFMSGEVPESAKRAIDYKPGETVLQDYRDPRKTR